MVRFTTRSARVKSLVFRLEKGSHKMYEGVLARNVCETSSGRRAETCCRVVRWANGPAGSRRR